MEFEEACSEMDYIFENMNPVDKDKIPQKVRKFFKDNKSIFYKVKLDPSKNLEEQELKEETKAFIMIINYKYLKGEKAKEKFNEILQNDSSREKNEIENLKEDTTMIIYKENKIIAFFKNLFKNIKNKNEK